jgi:hypothetical protein
MTERGCAPARNDRVDRRAAGALGTGAWAVAASATAALAHLAIERLDDAAGTVNGFASHTHPLFGPIVLLTVALSGLGLWSAVARSLRGEHRDFCTTTFFGASIRRVSSATLTAMVFGGALAILLSAESVEQIAATGHACLRRALPARHRARRAHRACADIVRSERRAHGARSLGCRGASA